jgi:lysophospholipase L1-like esterase
MVIVCMGDSIVEGEGDESGLSGWVGRLQQKILKGARVGQHRVYNLGMGMETSMDLLHRFFSEVLYRNPEILILQGAHGDSRSVLNKYDKEEFEIGKGARLRVYHRIFAYLSKSKIKVLILGLNPVSLNVQFKKAVPERAKHIEDHNTGLEKLCRKYKFPFLDPREIFKGRKLEDLYVDGLHPNSKGYELMFRVIYQKLKELRYIE